MEEATREDSDRLLIRMKLKFFGVSIIQIGFSMECLLLFTFIRAHDSSSSPPREEEASRINSGGFLTKV